MNKIHDADGSFKFNCPYCSQSLAATAELSGMNLNCPSCGNGIVVSDFSPRSHKRQSISKSRVLTGIVLLVVVLISPFVIFRTKDSNKPAEPSPLQSNEASPAGSVADEELLKKERAQQAHNEKLRALQKDADRVREQSVARAEAEALTRGEFALIPAGVFMMGDTLDGNINSNATPHKVNVSAFYIQKNLVSKAQWDEVRRWGLKNGYSDLKEGQGKAESHPVQSVSWYDVVKWCNAKSEKDGLNPCYFTDEAKNKVYRMGEVDLTNAMVMWNADGYRLPTEAEWEKSARGGLIGKRFPWGDTISHTQANFYNFAGESYQSGSTRSHPTYATGDKPYTSPVGSFAVNGYGLYDMAGNVYQWCWDYWDKNYPSTSQTDPRGPLNGGGPVKRNLPSNSELMRGDVSAGAGRVMRGGNWCSNAAYCRVFSRNNSCLPGAINGHTNLGFRPACNALKSN